MTTVVATGLTTEDPLVDGGNGAGVAFNNAASDTWTVHVTSGSGVILGIGSASTDDALTRCNGRFGLLQIVRGTISRTGTPGAAEVELHGFCTMIPVSAGNSLIGTIENDFTATVANIVTWLFNKGSFNVFGGGTTTELVDGDVITVVHQWFYKRLMVEAFINGVSVFTAIDTSGVVPADGRPGVGLDDQGVGGLFAWKNFSAFSPTPSDFSGFPKQMLSARFEGTQA